jgi:predicted enzyme related to lactoylglutathione lyase
MKARVDLVLDCAEPQTLAEFWREALGYRTHFTYESIVVLVPEDGTGPPLVLQRVPEPKSAKNRMHVDIVADEIEPVVERLEGLGAQRVHDGVRTAGGARWISMADPAGNEFCVCTGVEY